jgi:hypothetical protein
MRHAIVNKEAYFQISIHKFLFSNMHMEASINDAANSLRRTTDDAWLGGISDGHTAARRAIKFMYLYIL